MTNVNSSAAAAPSAQPAYEEVAADPPTIKNAGKLHSESSAAVSATLALMAVFAVVAGGMLLAGMASHGRGGRGFLLHTGLGAAAYALVFTAFAIDPWVDNLLQVALGTAIGVGGGWLLVTGMSYAIGKMARPISRVRRPV
jgi:hypothetical protein